MLKKLFTMLVVAIGVATANAQSAWDIPEPDFVGECVLCTSDQPTMLDKELSILKTGANTAMKITGFGKVKSELEIEGATAMARCKSGIAHQIIVKAIDNESDPMSVISVFQMEKKKKSRKLEVGSVTTFGSAKSGKKNTVKFQGKKYGEKSYLITLPKDLSAGEYGIIVNNPNDQDSKECVIACFGID